jgi:hypothetical protein
MKEVAVRSIVRAEGSNCDGGRMSGKLFLPSLAIAVAIGQANHLSATSYPGPAIVAELDQLNTSIQAYKEKYLVYPPCMGESDPEVRKRQFMQHLRTVYPSSAYGVSAVDFDDLAKYIALNYRVPAGDGTVALDLHRLDPAESLVFWLGGFPTPVSNGQGGGQPIASSRLFGFNRDSDTPLRRSVSQEGTDPLATRRNSRFDFREYRLVDNDEDGWWEYVPTAPLSDAPVAPFVYFDSATYIRSSTATQLLGTVLYPTDPKLAVHWGTVVPFAETYDPANRLALNWQNPDSFQIVCGGLDGTYSAPTTGARIELFPGGKAYRGPTFAGPPVEGDEEELDNLTNLARTTLSGDEATAHRQWHFFSFALLWFAAFLAMCLIVTVLKRCGLRPTSRMKRTTIANAERNVSTSESP